MSRNRNNKGVSMYNKVTKKECLDAIQYFWTMGMMEQMRSDEEHYVNVLLKKVANDYSIELK